MEDRRATYRCYAMARCEHSSSRNSAASSPSRAFTLRTALLSTGVCGASGGASRPPDLECGNARCDPLVGGHYFVDVIAGVSVAALTIQLSEMPNGGRRCKPAGGLDAVGIGGTGSAGRSCLWPRRLNGHAVVVSPGLGYTFGRRLVAPSGRPGMSARCPLLGGEADLICSARVLPGVTRSRLSPA